MDENQSFTMINNAVIRDTNLTPLEKMAYVALAHFADSQTCLCYPSYPTMSGIIGCSPRKAIDLVKKLVEVGYVTKISKAKDGKNSHACNLYRVHKMATETGSVASPVITNATSLPSAEVAFPHMPELFDDSIIWGCDTDRIIEIGKISDDSAITFSRKRNSVSQSAQIGHAQNALPSASSALPHAPDSHPHEQDAHKLNVLNYIQLNQNQSVNQSRSDRLTDGVGEEYAGERFDDALIRIDEHFGHQYFKEESGLYEEYKSVTQYMAEMLIDEYTKISSKSLSSDMLAKIIFDANTETLQNFLNNIVRTIKNPHEIRYWGGYIKTCVIEYFREYPMKKPHIEADVRRAEYAKRLDELCNQWEDELE